MSGPFTYPVADSLPMDNDSSRTAAHTEDVQAFINEISPPDRSEKPIFLANGELDYIEFFEGSTQTTPFRRYRVDMTYDGDLNPTTEVWSVYDPIDGTTVLRIWTYTHTWVTAEITKTTKAVV